MAIIKNSVVLQNASGSLGEFYVRTFRGKKLLVRKPFKRKVSHSPAAVKERKNFAASVLMSKTINRQPVLKELWKIADIKASSPYQKMMAFNTKRSDNGYLTTSNGITPGGIRLVINSALVEDNYLNLNFNLPTVDNIIFPAKLFAFMYFKKLNVLFALSDDLQDPSPDASYTLNISLDTESRKALKKDVNPLIYVAVVGSTQFKEKEYWSGTAVTQL